MRELFHCGILAPAGPRYFMYAVRPAPVHPPRCRVDGPRNTTPPEARAVLFTSDRHLDTFRVAVFVVAYACGVMPSAYACGVMPSAYACGARFRH